MLGRGDVPGHGVVRVGVVTRQMCDYSCSRPRSSQLAPFSVISQILEDDGDCVRDRKSSTLSEGIGNLCSVRFQTANKLALVSLPAHLSAVSRVGGRCARQTCGE